MDSRWAASSGSRRARGRPDNDRARTLLGADRAPLRNLMRLMQRDHYLELVPGGAYRFRFDLIRRWWRCDLGLD